MKMIRRSGFANVGRKYKSKRQVRNNIQRCYDADPEADWSFAEIDEADPANETGMVRDIFGPTHRIFGIQKRTPNVIRTKGVARKVIGRTPIKGCNGIAKWGPARWLVETIVSDPDFNIPVVEIATHFLRSGRRDADVQRELHFKVLQTRINYWLSRNHVVEIKMDFNGNSREKVQSLHSKAKILVDGGIDWIVLICPDDIKSRKLSEKTVPMNIDGHNGHIVRYSLETKS